MVPGIELQLGEQKYVVPPLSAGQLKRLREKFKSIRELRAQATGIGDESFDQINDLQVDIIHAAVQRNYPSLTREQMDDLIDLGNLQKAVAAVMAQSGLVQTAAGESSPGEPKPAGASTAPSSGATSTV